MEKKKRPTSLADLGIVKFIPAFVCFIAVFVLVILPESDLPSSHSWLQISYLDKWIHAIMFTILTFLFLLPVAESDMYKQHKRHYFIRICISVCIWGITTEFIQKFFVPSRSFDLLDWAADSAGILVAILYIRRFHRR